ncbi:MAG TPA: hypothetical protein VF808_06015 [Ktedonobacterales bacterium]
MGDPRLAIGDEAPLDEWPTMTSSHPTPDGRPPAQSEAAPGSRAPRSPGASGKNPANAPANTPPQTPAPAQQAIAPRPDANQLTHVPWTVASTWGASSLNTPNTLAGMSYLFWWVSGLMVYFNERHNRFVRFHAVQSILLTGALTVASVLFYMLWELSGDLAAATHQPAWAHLGQGVALLGFLAVIGIWLAAMIAAWSGHHLRLPIVGAYAERYAAPPREPYPPSPFSPQ